MKKFKNKQCLPLWWIDKTVKIMKLSILFLIFSLTIVHAHGFSQDQKINVNVKNASLLEVINLIENQSDCTFLFSTKDIQTIGGITLKGRNVKVSYILDKCLSINNLDWQVDNNLIILKKKIVTQQQEYFEVEGTVKDKKGGLLPGVTVRVKGTVIGTSTNVKGQFKIKFPKIEKQILIFSFIGMETKEVLIKGKKIINVVLENKVSELDDVVVTGIFNHKASTFTGSVTTFKGEQLKSVSNSNVFESLKNLDPSLMILDNMDMGSDPNNMPKMLLRGTTSFDLQTEATSIKGTYGSSPNAPLFILDGFEASVEKILDLDMNRVESITILKDASAKAIYGSKAANGVIVIETKVNPDGEIRLTYDGSMSIEVPDLTSYELMNAKEKLQFEVDYGLYDDKMVGVKKLYQQRLRDVKEGVDTDWLALPLRNGIGNKHRVGFEMGTEKLKLIAGFSYNNIVGAMKGSDRTLFSGDISVAYRFNRLNVRNQLNISSNISNDSPYGNFYEYSNMNPYYSPYDREGNIVKHSILPSELDNYSYKFYVDIPLYNSKVGSMVKNKYTDITNNFYLEYFWNDYLKTSFRLGFTLKNTDADEFYPAGHSKFSSYTTEELILRKGSYQKNNGNGKRFSSDLNVSYSRNFGKHFLMFNVGGKLYNNTYEELIYKAEGFPSEDMNSMMFARQYAKNTKPVGSENTTHEIGFLSVVNYAYDNRLLFDASLRSTGSSQYGSNKRWGSFWSLGMGWNIHNESWLDYEFIDNIKLRASIGTTGSQPPRAYAGIAAYEYIMNKTYSGMYGLRLLGMKNNDLKWQKKFDINIGLDLHLFDKLAIVLDFYKSTTKNSLIYNTLAPSTGFNMVDENVGEVVNKGLDLRLTYTFWSEPKNRSFLNLSLTASRNKNEIKELSNAMNEYNKRIDDLFMDEDRETMKPLKKYYEGASMNSIWAMKSDGIDPMSGREIFVKKDGTRTFDYIASEQQICGNSLPKVQGAMSLALQYKSVGLNLSLRYMYGGQMYNSTLATKVEAYDIKNNVDRRVLEGSWMKPGDIKSYARHSDMVRWGYYDGNYTSKIKGSAPTERFVFDRNELSLSSINIYYDFWKSNFVKKLGLDRAKLSFYGNNLYTWSTVKQERGTSYPFARTFNFALSVAF